MGNCQATDAASVIIEHPGGKIEKIYWPVSANKVMVSNPGNYVALIITDSFKDESDVGAGAGAGASHKHLKLLRPDDTLLIGHNYRLVSFEDVLMEFSGKSYVKLNKLISSQKAKGSSQESVQSPFSSSVVKECRSEMEKEAFDPNRALGFTRSMRRRGQWRPALQSISEIGH